MYDNKYLAYVVVAFFDPSFSAADADGHKNIYSIFSARL
jgi:hypothetical protein